MVSAYQGAGYAVKAPLAPTPRLLRWATEQRGRESRHPMNRAALDYWLSLVTNPGDAYVSDLVRTALRARPPRAGNLDTLSALPEALETIAVKRHNRTAWNYLITLSLDGGPGDTLTTVRVREFTLDNREFIAALRGPCGSNGSRAASLPRVRSLANDLETEWRGEPSFRRFVGSRAKEKSTRSDGIARFTMQFCRAIAANAGRRGKSR